MQARNDEVSDRGRDLAPIGALLGHPARAAMLAALADGRALPAGELARHARIAPATATVHLRQLVEGGLVSVRSQGRHRYHELAGPDVAAALEAVARIAPPVAVYSLRQDRAQRAIAEARTCYDHLAGRLGVELRDRLLATGVVRLVGGKDHELSDEGRTRVAELGIDVDEIERSRRIFARTCIDWTHRRPHLAGALPAAITARLLDLEWVTRARGRGLSVAPDYEQHLNDWLPRREPVRDGQPHAPGP